MESSTPLAENFERNRSNPPPKRYHHKRRRYEIDICCIYFITIVAINPTPSTKMTTENHRRNYVYIVRTQECRLFFMLLAWCHNIITTYIYR